MNTTEMLYNLNEMRYVAESASEDDRLEKIPKRARVAKQQNVYRWWRHYDSGHVIGQQCCSEISVSCVTEWERWSAVD